MSSLLRQHVSLSNLVKDSINMLRETVRTCTPSSVGISFNGGKDSMVTLELLRVALEREKEEQKKDQEDLEKEKEEDQDQNQDQDQDQNQDQNQEEDHEEDHEERETTTTDNKVVTPFSITGVYFRTPDSFPEVDKFVSTVQERYHLQILTITSPTIKDGLNVLKEIRPEITALILGTRRTDPHGKTLEPLASTSEGWPDYMRVHPILEWDYASIWRFTHSLSLPYCCLYEQGYTSIGGTRNTIPNPSLLRPDREGEEEEKEEKGEEKEKGEKEEKEEKGEEEEEEEGEKDEKEEKGEKEEKDEKEEKGEKGEKEEKEEKEEKGEGEGEKEEKEEKGEEEGEGEKEEKGEGKGETETNRKEKIGEHQGEDIEKNPKISSKDIVISSYYPAWFLADGSMERDGRK